MPKPIQKYKKIHIQRSHVFSKSQKLQKTNSPDIRKQAQKESAEEKKRKMLCYVGKATKIFIFVVTALVVTGLVLGFGILRRHNSKSHKCTADSCPQPVNFPYSNPNPTSTYSPNPVSVQPQPPRDDNYNNPPSTGDNNSQPSPPMLYPPLIPPPPSENSNPSQSPPTNPESPPPTLVSSPPPPPPTPEVAMNPPPPEEVVVEAPPPGFSPPSPVPVTPGPVNSS